MIELLYGSMRTNEPAPAPTESMVTSGSYSTRRAMSGSEAMAKLQVEAESIALPLPIRNQKRQDFEALKQRCG